MLIRRGLAALARAEAIGGIAGPYVLQASIAACHARARTADETNWVRIAAFYSVLGTIQPSPVVELNRAMAVAMAHGPAAGLEIADKLGDEPALKNYHFLPASARDLLSKLGRHAEARDEYERAAEMTRNARERELLLAQGDGGCRKRDRGRLAVGSPSGFGEPLIRDSSTETGRCPERCLPGPPATAPPGCEDPRRGRRCAGGS